MKTKVKLDNFDLTVYPGGFSFWHKGVCIIDASKFEEDREVVFRKGGDARLKATVINVNSGPSGPPTGNKSKPADIKEKFTEFIAGQKDIPPEFAQVVNDNFWDLI